MIRLDVIADGHFAISGNEPFRIEVLDTSAKPECTLKGIIAYVYAGAEEDPDDDPIGGYDSFEESESWVYTAQEE